MNQPVAEAARPQAVTPLVYTMGKVASSSVSSAILAAGLPCYDVHSLNPDYIKKTAQSWLNRGEFPPPHICVSMAFRDRIFTRKPRCLYITLVRDPLARNLSAFFQNLHQQSEFVRNEQDPQSLFEYFRHTYNHNLPLTWFDREFKKQLKLDVLKLPFDHQRRFSYHPTHNLVVFRTDCPDSEKSRVLTEILGRPISVERENDGLTKDYRDRYERVKAVARFDREFVERIYESRYARRFWSDEERAQFISQWSQT